MLTVRDGMTIYNKSFSYFDYENRQPVTETSIYDLASASKTARTLLAIMKAYDEERFILNNKISGFIPELKGSNKKGLSMKELLHYQSEVTPAINFYLDAVDKDSYKGSLYSLTKNATRPVRFNVKTYIRNDFKYLPDIISDMRRPGSTAGATRNFCVSNSFKDTTLQDIKKFHLGTRGRYVYDCVNFTMLKMMVENLMRSPMDQLLWDDFYNGLGAWHTAYNPLRRMDTLQVVPTEQDGFVYRQLLRGYVHGEVTAFQGGVSRDAGLFSNVNDLAEML